MGHKGVAWGCCVQRYVRWIGATVSARSARETPPYCFPFQPMSTDGDQRDCSLLGPLPGLAELAFAEPPSLRLTQGGVPDHCWRLRPLPFTAQRVNSMR